MVLDSFLSIRFGFSRGEVLIITASADAISLSRGEAARGLKVLFFG